VVGVVEVLRRDALEQPQLDRQRRLPGRQPGAFGEPTLAVDTHVFRVANRTGLAPGKTPLAVELGLLERVPAKYLDDAHHWLILHGRYVCLARMPQCGRCAVSAWCDFYRALPEAARPKPGEAAPDAKAMRAAGIEP